MNKLLSEVESIFEIVRNADISRIFKVDLTRSEFILLKIIDDIENEKSSKTVAVSDIVDKMEVTAQAISKCLKNLESKEYIERFSSRKDRRRMEVVMTKKGRDAHSSIVKKTDAIFKSVLDGFEKEEFEEYVRLTRKFRDLYVDALNCAR